MTGWPVSHVSLPLALFINRKRKRQPLYLITGEIIPYLGCWRISGVRWVTPRHATAECFIWAQHHMLLSFGEGTDEMIKGRMTSLSTPLTPTPYSHHMWFVHFSCSLLTSKVPNWIKIVMNDTRMPLSRLTRPRAVTNRMLPTDSPSSRNSLWDTRVYTEVSTWSWGRARMSHRLQSSLRSHPHVFVLIASPNSGQESSAFMGLHWFTFVPLLLHHLPLLLKWERD